MIKDIVTANVKKLIDEFDGGIPTRAARRLKLNQRTLDRYYKGEQTPSVEYIDAIARGCGLHAWQLLLPDLDPSNPPILSLQTKEERELYARLKSTFAELQNIKP